MWRCCFWDGWKTHTGPGGDEELWFNCVRFEMPRRHPSGDASQPGVPGGRDLGNMSSQVVQKLGNWRDPLRN